MRDAVLDDAVATLGIMLSDDHHNCFKRFYGELQRWNSKINLTSITNPREVSVKHFGDSLQLLPYLPNQARLLDIGSGGGFPSIPLAIVRPDLRITSVEAIGKKAAFQRHIVRALGLQLTVIQERIEQASLLRDQLFDCVTSRAFTDPLAFVRIASPFVAPGGSLLIMAGHLTRVDIEQLKVVAEECGLQYGGSFGYHLIDGYGDHQIIVMKKQ